MSLIFFCSSLLMRVFDMPNRRMRGFFLASVNSAIPASMERLELELTSRMLRVSANEM